MGKIKALVDLLAGIASADQPDADVLERFRDRYQALPAKARPPFFAAVSRGMEVTSADVSGPLREVSAADPSDFDQWSGRVRRLREALESPRRRALDRLSNVPGGIKLLVEMRAEILDAQRAGHGGLDPLEADIAGLLNGWFSHGFLYLDEIDQSSSFSKIRFLKERELVHPMVRLEEMGRRLGEDRRCFALYHAAIPDEPVVFIEVALSRGLIRSIHTIIDATHTDREPVADPNTAVFYSINNTQNGLAGLGLGRVLIGRVTEALEQRHPSLGCFATLSPLPHFRDRYLLPLLLGEGDGLSLSRDEVVEMISARGWSAIRRRAGLDADGDDPAELGRALAEVLSDPGWIGDQAVVKALRKPLADVAYHYLTAERDGRGRPLDRVAGFHLGNGASLARRNVNFGANTSRRGLEESAGVMVNYIYSVGTFQQIGRTVRHLLPWGH